MTTTQRIKPLTSGLFKEYDRDTLIDPEDRPYSIHDFKRVFLEKHDFTGYLCAQELLTHNRDTGKELEPYQRWEEWKRLFSSNWLAKHLRQWQRELQIKMQAEAINKIAEGADPKAFPALKWIVEGKPFDNLADKRGRPKKDREDEERERKEALRDRVGADRYDNVIQLTQAKKKAVTSSQ